jgi:hypothetical protein
MTEHVRHAFEKLSTRAPHPAGSCPGSSAEQPEPPLARESAVGGPRASPPPSRIGTEH